MHSIEPEQNNPYLYDLIPISWAHASRFDIDNRTQFDVLK
jgi:hypothetical protein